VPIGIVTIGYISLTVKGDHSTNKLNIDILDNLLLILAIAGAVIFLVEGKQFGYLNLRIVPLISLAIIFGWLLILREKKSAQPIIPITLLKLPRFTVMNLVGLLTNVSLYGIVLVLGLYFQMALHCSSILSGLLILPGMTVLVIGNIFYAKYVAEFNPVRLANVAIIVTLVGSTVLYLLSLFIKPLPVFAIILLFSVMSIGIGVLVPASTTLLMAVSGTKYSGIAGATLNANKQIGGLFGTAIMGMVISSFGTNWNGIIQMTFLINAGLYALGAFLIWKYVLVENKQKE
jgi:DHA2 family methylenomycin A resistance protein-like MFS transporter